MAANPTWDYDNLHAILIACVGMNFGENPTEKLDEIRTSRAHWGKRYAKFLEIGHEDVVLDIGSGCGFVTRPIVELAKHVICADISPAFLHYCRNELDSYDNVEFHQIQYGEFPDISDNSLDCIFSSAVFIHFNMYDFEIYLKEAKRMLKVGGRLAFDFLNADVLQLSQRTFRQCADNFAKGREKYIFNIVKPFSATALKNITEQLGFELKELISSGNEANANTVAVLKLISK